MKVRFWGVRGSIPSPISPADLEGKLLRVLQGAQGVDLADAEQVRRYLAQIPAPLRGTFGGNTSCVQVSSGDQSLILDAGSGMQRLGGAWLAADEATRARHHHIFISHLHWDHTIGLPFFAPLSDPACEVAIYGAHTGFREGLLAQHRPPNFPVPLEGLPARQVFRQIVPGQPLTVGPFVVDCMEMVHPGGSFAFRISDERAAVVYATDAGFPSRHGPTLSPYLAFVQAADLLICDAQFNSQEGLHGREGWGHSSPLVGADL
ncbi:MAG: MBL fold metallo-hydrolase, partial [Chloroflexi bacterium]|nr:MBL fold metallo-hydrolase [Chloroflexota bacterium]